jgi:hypothetical protein
VAATGKGAELVDDCLLGVLTASQVEPRRIEPVPRLTGLWRWLLLPALVPDDRDRTDLVEYAERLGVSDLDTIMGGVSDDARPAEQPAG